MLLSCLELSLNQGQPTALGPGANTDTKLLIYGLFQKGRVLAQDGVQPGVPSNNSSARPELD